MVLGNPQWLITTPDLPLVSSLARSPLSSHHPHYVYSPLSFALMIIFALMINFTKLSCFIISPSNVQQTNICESSCKKQEELFFRAPPSLCLLHFHATPGEKKRITLYNMKERYKEHRNGKYSTQYITTTNEQI